MARGLRRSGHSTFIRDFSVGAPGFDQINRFKKIGQILQARPDDAAWGFIVVNEFYLVQMQDTIAQGKMMLKVCIIGLSFIIIMLGFLLGIQILSRPQDVASLVHREISEAVNQLSNNINQQRSCSSNYDQDLCDALKAASENPTKKTVILAAAKLNDDSTKVLASYTHLTELFTAMSQWTPIQWHEIEKVLAPPQLKQKGQNGR